MKTTLLKALRIVGTADARDIRANLLLGAVMCQHAHIRRTVRVYDLLKASPLSFLSGVMVAGYGALALTTIIPQQKGADILATASSPNEKLRMNFMGRCIGASRIAQAQNSWFQLLNPVTITRMIALVLRLLPLILRLNRKYSFLPAARVVQALFFYCAFSHILRTRPCAATLVASNYSPDTLGLVLSARARGIPSIFVSHAFFGPDAPILNIRFELSVLSGLAELGEYGGTGFPGDNILFSGLDGESRPLRLHALKPAGMNIIICLTGCMDADGLEQLVAFLQNTFEPSLISIRQHPQKLDYQDIPEAVMRQPNVRISGNATLWEDLKDFDLVVAGNSNVHLQALKYGVPTLYTASLDTLPHDFKGFVHGGVVPGMATASVEALRRFYTDSKWPERFSRYDASYMQSPEQIAMQVRKAVEAVAGAGSP